MRATGNFIDVTSERRRRRIVVNNIGRDENIYQPINSDNVNVD
jgi:hypothetical protein